jgi:hypothetical protein
MNQNKLKMIGKLDGLCLIQEDKPMGKTLLAFPIKPDEQGRVWRGAVLSEEVESRILDIIDDMKEYAKSS